MHFRLRCFGKGTPEQNIARRDAAHHMNEKGFGPAQLDKSSANPHAIRGRGGATPFMPTPLKRGWTYPVRALFYLAECSLSDQGIL